MSQRPQEYDRKTGSFFSTPLECLLTVASAITSFWAAPLLHQATSPAVERFTAIHYGTELSEIIWVLWFAVIAVGMLLLVRAGLVTAIRLTSAFIASRFQ